MISAIILAAGLSTRMGTPKLLLPWGSTKVIVQVITTLLQAGVDEVVVVTGGEHSSIEQVLQWSGFSQVHVAFNPCFAEDSMLLSLKVGLNSVYQDAEAVLICLGDQPQIEVGVVQALLASYKLHHYPIIVPSYQMHRGHPWMVDRSLWSDFQSAQAETTLWMFLYTHTELITHIIVDTPSILQDLDTPEDYSRFTDSSLQTG